MPFDIRPPQDPILLPAAPWRERVRAWAPTWTPKQPLRLALALVAILAVALTIFVLILFSPPSSFPQSTIVRLTEGAPAIAMASELKEAHIVRSARAFYLLARITGSDRSLETGAYVFTERAWLPTVLWRVSNGEHGIEPILVTLPEGITRYGISDTLARELPGFDPEAFLLLSSTSEGYLFPETYQFMPGDTADAIVLRLKSQFSASIASITPQVLSSKHGFADIVIVASMLEREARTPEEMRMVAGIMWNRLAKGMPLQIDAVFGYMHREDGYTPTAADLESDSPYNTYRNKGLPPTPISNPGLTALLAAALPAKTSYMYYLTGVDGNMYYATTFEGHKQNRAKYLDI